MIPHARIRADRDRSWTAALLRALHDPDERDDAAQTLAELADPRAEAALTGLVVSPAIDRELRRLAGRVLCTEYDPPPVEVSLRWWERGDAILRAHALAVAPAESPVVLAVAATPDHPLHEDAIAAMTFRYERPRHQALKIAALGHARPEVRIAAAQGLLYDEPVSAEAALIAALHDDDDAVADAARQALSYYDSRRALTAVVEGPGPRDPTARARAIESFSDAVEAAPGAVRAALSRWLAPVAHLLEVQRTGAARLTPTSPHPPTAPPTAPTSVDELRAILDAADGPWAPLWGALGALDPRTIDAAAQPELAVALQSHADPAVRARAAGWFAIWGERAGLRALLDDESARVRKAAAYHIHALPPDPDLAGALLIRLAQPGVAGVHAAELVRAYAAHAGADAALAELATDERESVSLAAIDALIARGDRDAVAALLPRLREPPAKTWALHGALLSGARRLGLAAPLAAVADADSLQVQLELAWLAAAS